MADITKDRIVDLRLRSLLLAPHELSTPSQIINWFGAMQAQDLASGKWSFGARLPGLTESDIDTAIERGRVLRTWPMRGTIHFVPPQDAAWMLRTTGERALRGAEARRRYLGLDLAEAERACGVLGEALSGGRRVTRADAVQIMAEAGIATAGQHTYHLLWYASQKGVLCIGPNRGKEQTFVLLREWARQPRDLDRDEGLALIALRFIRSHGPVTHQDLMRWADITAKDAKAAIAANGDALVQVRCDGSGYWATAQSLDATSERPGEQTLVLPGFDEWMLGYKNRSLMLPERHKDAIVPGGNGVFQPTITDRGQVIGTWRRAVRRTTVDIKLLPFEPLPATVRRRVERAFRPYGTYLGRELRFVEADRPG